MTTNHSAQTIWQELVAAALVGQERGATPIPSASGKLGAVLATLATTKPDPDQVLLTAAGVVLLYRRAGARPVIDSSSLPEPCPADERPACGERSSGHLARMLAGQFREVLPEWLAAMAQAGRRAREEDLVALLEQGRNHRGLREAITLVLGNRGRWLAAHNVAWSYATEGQNPKGDWQTASREWRLDELKRCRASDPVRAREIVASTWNQETPADRALFLETFTAGLSIDDEPFLESALDDKHAGVRRAAAELLARLAESRLCQRMIARVGPLVQFSQRKSKLQIDITLPDQHTKDMARDGVEKKTEGMGEKNAWLHQLLARVPPTYWCQATGRSAAELIAAAERSEWKPTLMSAWTAAARRHSDIDWIEAILTCNEWRNAPPNTSILEQVFSCLPRARQEKLLVQLLWAAPGALPNPAEFLQRIDSPWGLELSHAVIEFLKQETKSRGGQLNGLTRVILRLAAGRMPPSCAEEVAEKLQPRPESSPPILIQAVNESLELLQFRHEMLSELMP
jgi:hypothetical protein